MLRRSLPVALCVLLILGGLPLQASARDDLQRAVPALQDDIRAKMEALRAASGVPGISVGFVLEDGQTGAVAVGLADTEKNIPLTTDHLLLAGSIGKTYAAAVALQLVAEGKLDLDAPISRWLGSEPWFKRLPNAAAITLRMLMRHQSGIREHVLAPKLLDRALSEPDHVWKPDEIIQYALDQPPLFEAGKGWSYADTNYILVGMVVEKAAGRPIFEEISRRLLKPLKLTRTRPADSRTIPGLAVGHSQPNSPFRTSGPVVREGRFFMNPQVEWTGGGFATTPLDLARWAKSVYEGDVLSPAMKAAMLEGVPARTGRGDQYGLGVQIRESPWGVSYGHGGWFPGYLSEVEYYPEKRVAVAVQISTDDMAKLGRRPRAVLAEVARILMGPGKPPAGSRPEARPLPAALAR